MPSTLRAVTASAVFAFLVGIALWPPRAVYWRRLAPVVGEGVTLAVVCLLALTVGAAFARTTGVGAWPFAVGGLVAYLVGMVAIAAVLRPDSPVHLLWYAALLGCLAGGVAIVAVLPGR